VSGSGQDKGLVVSVGLAVENDLRGVDLLAAFGAGRVDAELSGNFRVKNENFVAIFAGECCGRGFLADESPCRLVVLVTLGRENYRVSTACVYAVVSSSCGVNDLAVLGAARVCSAGLNNVCRYGLFVFAPRAYECCGSSCGFSIGIPVPVAFGNGVNVTLSFDRN